MIEVIYKEDTVEQDSVREQFAMPRNVRQIGLANGNYRIYVEDYVYTFLSCLGSDGKTEGQGKAAVLTGEIQWTADMTCIFIKGALAADEMEATAEHIDFSEKIWQKLQEDKEKYFPEQEIVGWFFAQQQMAVEITDLFVKVHLRHFGGEKVLMLMDPGEREDAFFRYENGTMTKVSGYYIYYEKNSQMQTYMIERSQNEGGDSSEKVEDRAVRNFRKIIDGKKPEEREQEKTSVFSYAATVCLALAVLVTGVNFYRNQQEKSGVSEDYRETSAVVAQMTPVITEQASVQITETPTPSVKVQNQERITVTPAAEKRGQELSDSAKTAKTSRTTPAAQKKSSQKKEEKTSVTEDSSKKSPEKEISEETSEKETSASAENTQETYVIRPGDTLYQISLNRYGTVEAMEQICARNGISADEIIYPGQVIVLP